MADTKAQIKAERWIVKEYLPKLFNHRFEEKQTTLQWGGKFKFDAVSEDGEIVVNISTSSAKTAREKQAIGKRHKIKADVSKMLAKGSKNESEPLGIRTPDTLIKSNVVKMPIFRVFS